MLNIGFMELLLIMIVALLVLGPEKLPGAIRTGALWLGRARRSFNQVKAEIEQQINADDIRRQLHNESILADIEKAKKNASKLIKDTQQDLEKAGAEVKEAGDTLQKSVDDVKNIQVVTSSADEGIPTDSGELPADKSQGSDSSEPDAQAETTPPSADDTDTLAKKPAAPAQDFYNTPPTGRVVIQDGKFASSKTDDSNPNDSQAESDVAADKGDNKSS